MRRAARTDDNHALIRDGLRRIPGVSVADTSKAGDGFPDLVVGYRGRNYLFEVKNPNRPPSRRRLRKSQADFQAAWRGQYTKVETRDDVLRLIGLVDN